MMAASLMAFGGGPLEGDRIVRLAYVDEAGISKSEPFLVVAAVLIDADRQLIALERHLDRLVAKWIPAHQADDFVFHATDLFNGSHKGSGKPFERENPDWPLEKRLDIADDLAAIPRRFNLQIAFGWIERGKFPTSAEAIARWEAGTEAQRAAAGQVTAFMAAALKIEHWIRDNAPSEVCMMIVEDNEQARSLIRETQNYHQDARIVPFLDEKQRQHFPLRRIKEDPLFQKKRKSSVLQIADFSAYVFKKFLMNDKRYARFIKPMYPQFYKTFTEEDSSRGQPS